MKKYLVIAMFIATLGMPAFSFAQQTDANAPGNNNCAVLNQNLYFGAHDSSSNSDVFMLQDFLNSNGYLKASPNGFFGRQTWAGVKKFQSDNGITPTGNVGPFTRAKIQQIDCNPTTPTTPTNTSGNTIQSVNPANTPSVSPTVSTPNANVMSQTQAQAFVSSLGISGVAAQTLISALTTTPNANSTNHLNPANQPVVTPANTPAPACNDRVCLGNTTSTTNTTGTTTTTNTVCGANSTPSITVISPNGGEVYTAGQQVTVNWTSCNIPSGDLVNIFLDIPSMNWSIGLLQDNVPNSGSYTVTLPAKSWVPTFPSGNIFRIAISKTLPSSALVAIDYSNSTFTINDNSTTNTTATTTTTTDDYYSRVSTAVFVSKNAAFPNQSVTSGTVHQKIASFIVQNTSSNPFNFVTTAIGFSTNAPISNVSLYISGTQFGSTIPSDPYRSFVFSTNTAVPANQSITIDVYADINSNSSPFAFNSSLNIRGTDPVTNLHFLTLPVTGQMIYVLSSDTTTTTTTTTATSTTNSTCSVESLIARQLSVTKNSAYADQSFLAGSNHVKVGSYLLTNNTCDTVTVNSVKFGLTSSSGSALNNFGIYVGGVNNGSSSNVNPSTQPWTINATVARNQSVTVDIYGDIPQNATGTYQATFATNDGNRYLSSTSNSAASGQIITVTPVVVSSNSCDIDLMANTNTCSGVASITMTSQGGGQSVMAINLTQNNVQMKKVKFDVTFGTNPDGWNVDIGNSPANDGYGGGSGAQSNTAEMQLLSYASANSYAFSVYGNDDILYHPTDALDGHLLIHQDTGTTSLSGKTVSFTVSDKNLAYDLSSANSPQVGNISSPYLYALAGEPDFDTHLGSNNVFYAAFNRVISNNSRSGFGVSKVHVSFQ